MIEEIRILVGSYRDRIEYLRNRKSHTVDAGMDEYLWNKQADELEPIVSKLEYLLKRYDDETQK